MEEEEPRQTCSSLTCRGEIKLLSRCWRSPLSRGLRLEIKSARYYKENVEEKEKEKVGRGHEHGKFASVRNFRIPTALTSRNSTDAYSGIHLTHVCLSPL
jgi:hypothetical protein